MTEFSDDYLDQYLTPRITTRQLLDGFGDGADGNAGFGDGWAPALLNEGPDRSRYIGEQSPGVPRWMVDIFPQYGSWSVTRLDKWGGTGSRAPYRMGTMAELDQLAAWLRKHDSEVADQVAALARGLS